MANIEDPDEMPHEAAFHQGLHCLLGQNVSSEKEIIFGWEIITFDPSMYTLDHSDFILSSFMENSISHKRVKS